MYTEATDPIPYDLNLDLVAALGGAVPLVSVSFWYSNYGTGITSAQFKSSNDGGLTWTVLKAWTAANDMVLDNDPTGHWAQAYVDIPDGSTNLRFVNTPSTRLSVKTGWT